MPSHQRDIDTEGSSPEDASSIRQGLPIVPQSVFVGMIADMQLSGVDQEVIDAAYKAATQEARRELEVQIAQERDRLRNHPTYWER